MAAGAGVDRAVGAGCEGAANGGVCAVGGDDEDLLAGATGAIESIRAGVVATELR